MPFKPGNRANPNGRPPIISHEIQREFDQNKVRVKQLILTYFNLTEEAIESRQRRRDIPFIEKVLGQCLERTANDGDVMKFKMLLEMVFGKIPEERVEFDLSPEEKLLVLTFRKKLDDRRSIPDSSANSDGSLESEDGSETTGTID